MAMIRFPTDFKEFLQLLEEHKVAYLLIGGYAVGFYGYPRSTGDMDVWIAVDKTNAEKMVHVIQEFGLDSPDLTPELFLKKETIFRMGFPPIRIEVLTSIDGVGFAECYARRRIEEIDGLVIPIINLIDLKTNKKASGRNKDLNDLENLP